MTAIKGKEEIVDITKDIIPEIVEIIEPDERVISIDRISRTVKGGRRIRFRALVVTGNGQNGVGIGVAKANDVQGAIAKAKSKAKKTVLTVPVINDTIAHVVQVTFGTTTVILKPAPQGHSIIAGGPVRAVVEMAGIKNIVSKAIGSANKINSATATYLALKELSLSPYIGRKK